MTFKEKVAMGAIFVLVVIVVSMLGKAANAQPPEFVPPLYMSG